jgi:hypothetical protein
MKLLTASLLIRYANRFEVVETPQRFEFYFPYNETFKNQLKSLGAKWDMDKKVWYMGKRSKGLLEAIDLFERLKGALSQKTDFKDDVARRKRLSLGVQIPFELKDEAKSRGGIWDKLDKVWLMPDASSKTEVLALAEQLKSQRRTPSPQAPKPNRLRDQALSLAEAQELDPNTVTAVAMGGERKGLSVREGQTLKVKGKVVKVLLIGEPKRIEDGRSFGYNFDDGWVYDVWVAEASSEDQDRVRQEEAVQMSRQQALKRLDDLAQEFQRRGDFPSPLRPESIRGEVVCEKNPRLRLTGGGSWFVITPNEIWYIRNNGADGDDWSQNNVSVNGGTPSMGWKVRKTPELEAELRQIHALV